MAIAKSFQNPEPPLLEEAAIKVNLDSLILAMLTAFDMKVTGNDLILNINNLFSELNLVPPENLRNEINETLNNLIIHNFIIAKKEEFSVSQLGRDHGMRALLNFRKSALEFFRN